jgi:hypothetical protein
MYLLNIMIVKYMDEREEEGGGIKLVACNWHYYNLFNKQTFKLNIINKNKIFKKFS